MARQLAHSMQTVSREGASPGQQRATGRRDSLKNEIRRFAGITHPDFTREANSKFLIRISEFTDYASVGELRRYKKGIQGGEQNEDYPISRIIAKGGQPAREIAAFLGAEYFDSFARILAGPNNIQERELAEDALKWAFENGDQKIRARALAGIAQGAAREAESCRLGLRSKGYAERTGQMGFLTKQIGLSASWRIVRRINNVRENLWSRIGGASFLIGASAAGTMQLFSEGMLQNGITPEGIAISMGPLIIAAGVLLQMAKTSLGGIQKTLLRELGKLPGDGHV